VTYEWDEGDDSGMPVRREVRHADVTGSIEVRWGRLDGRACDRTAV
jgi:hypothetical protein